MDGDSSENRRHGGDLENVAEKLASIMRFGWLHIARRLGLPLPSDRTGIRHPKPMDLGMRQCAKAQFRRPSKCRHGGRPSRRRAETGAIAMADTPPRLSARLAVAGTFGRCGRSAARFVRFGGRKIGGTISGPPARATGSPAGRGTCQVIGSQRVGPIIEKLPSAEGSETPRLGLGVAHLSSGCP